MGQEPNDDSASEVMAFGLIEEANRITRSAREAQQALIERIEGLGQLQQWPSMQLLRFRSEPMPGFRT